VRQSLSNEAQQIKSELRILKVKLPHMFITDRKHLAVCAAYDRLRAPIFTRDDSNFSNHFARAQLPDEPAGSVFFLQSGMVSVKLGNGTRLACLVPGMMFGEMALIEGIRLADVWADTPVQCLELPIDRFNEFFARYPHAGERVMRNLAVLLSQRLAQANNRVDLLSAHWPHAHEFRR
jgi:CRP-like cAMP-binding protein